MARGDDPAEHRARADRRATPGRDHRQLHMIDRAGRIAAHTGSACIDWCGHRAGSATRSPATCSPEPRVLDDTAAAFEAHGAQPLALRLLDAMAAGEAAGGDKRGKQAAALIVYTTESYPALDLRVDDHPEPIAELRRLYEKSLERFQPFVACLPAARRSGRHHRPGRCIEAEVERFQAARASASRRLTRTRAGAEPA